VGHMSFSAVESRCISFGGKCSSYEKITCTRAHAVAHSSYVAMVSMFFKRFIININY